MIAVPGSDSAQTLPYLCQRNYDEVEPLGSRALGAFPEFDLNRVWLALAYIGKGDLDRAGETVTDCELEDCIAILGMIHGIRGRTEEAMEALRNPVVNELESQGPIF